MQTTSTLQHVMVEHAATAGVLLGYSIAKT